MPDPQTHTTLGGIAGGYFTGVMLGLNPNFLVAGALGALMAEAKASPQEGVGKFRATIVATANIGSSSMMASLGAGLVSLQFPEFGLITVPCAAVVGYFGQPFIALITRVLDNGLDIIKQKLGVGNAN